jgi:NAD(P)-dependent dehydrogenase (short-subunit alcohol dehydrogenase family)
VNTTKNTRKNTTQNTGKNARRNAAENGGKTALVTGATSGLGLEAARQLAEAGYGRVIVTGRTDDKAAAAAEQLAQTAQPVFEPLGLDLNDPASVRAAADRLIEQGVVVDVLLLNAGMVSGSTRTITESGVETMISSSLIGHHQLTMHLIAANTLAPEARIVISGSEAARGDVPTFHPTDVRAAANEGFGGDRQAAVESLMRGEIPRKFKPGDTYADAKVFVAHWAAALARRLPDGTTVNAVSPGSAPNTNAIRNANFFMKRIMVPVFKHAPKRMGMAASTPVAAQRYVDATEFGADVTGEFFASAPKKMTGPIEKMDFPHIKDRDLQEATWRATIAISGNVDIPVQVTEVATSG